MSASELDLAPPDDVVARWVRDTRAAQGLDEKVAGAQLDHLIRLVYGPGRGGGAGA